MIDPYILHTHQSLFKDDLQFWLELAKRYPGPVLELGCGSGRVSSAFAQHGFHLIGIDRDFNLLTFLRRINSATLNNQIFLIQADFTHFNLAARFGLIIIPCNTFSSLTRTGRLDTLKMVRRHLLPTGVFAVQMTNPLLLASLPVSGEPEVEEVFNHPVSGEAVQVSSSWQRTAGQMTVSWFYDLLSDDGAVSRSSFSITHYLEDLSSIRAEFQQEHLIIQSELGDYKFSPFQQENPDWIILAGLE